MSDEHQRKLSADGELGNEILEILDEEGDIRLHAGRKKFLVSSKCLSLASTTFKGMLNDSKFLEAQTKRSPAEPFELPLGDDDPEALEISLRIIHFSQKQNHESLNSEQLLQVAKVADKYFCTSVIKYQARAWLAALQTQELDISSLWKLCGVAYLMGFEEDFARNLSRLSVQASSAELEDNLEDLNLPVDTMTWLELIEQTRYSIMQRLITKVEETMKDMLLGKRRFDTHSKICTRCNKNKPLSTKTCRNCKSETFWDVCCTPSLRLSDFYAELQTCGVWPLVLQIDASPLEFQRKLRFSTNSHRCDGNDQCPLIQAFNKLELHLKTEVTRQCLVNLESLSGKFSRGKSITNK